MYWMQVTARCGLALDSLQQLLDNGEAERYTVIDMLLGMVLCLA